MTMGVHDGHRPRGRCRSPPSAVHVSVALLVLLLSGLLMGRHGTLHNVLYTLHLASGGVLVGGLALIVLRGNRRALSQSRRDLSTLDALDRQWLARVPAAVFKRSP